jgi:hypothetical protein
MNQVPPSTFDQLVADESANRGPRAAPPIAPAVASWWWAVAAGTALGIPLGYLLSYGAALLAYLGLFFFMLFGLVIGAVMFRIGQPARPIARWKLRTGIGLVALSAWGTSLAFECWGFPSDVAETVLKPETRALRQRPDGRTPNEIKHEIEECVRDYLREAYPPGGPIGYIRWKVFDDELNVQITNVKPIRLPFKDNGGWWILRVVLSIAMLIIAIRAVVRPLGLADQPNRADPSPPDSQSVDIQANEPSKDSVEACRR